MEERFHNAAFKGWGFCCACDSECRKESAFLCVFMHKHALLFLCKLGCMHPAVGICHETLSPG